MRTPLQGTTKLPSGETLTIQTSFELPPSVTKDDLVDALLNAGTSIASSNHKIHTMMNKSFEADFRDTVAEYEHKHKLNRARVLWFAVGVWCAVLFSVAIHVWLT